MSNHHVIDMIFFILGLFDKLIGGVFLFYLCQVKGHTPIFKIFPPLNPWLYQLNSCSQSEIQYTT